MTNCIVIFVIAGSTSEGERLAKALVETRLAACVNIVSPVKSVFRWQGKVCEEKEVLLVIKSARENLDQVVEQVKKLHTYEVPEIIALPILGGSEDYLNWLRDESNPG